MKAESYLTLLDGLLATAIYYPRKHFFHRSQYFYWSVSLTAAMVIKDNVSITRIPAAAGRWPEALRERGTRTTATPVCGYRLSLHF